MRVLLAVVEVEASRARENSQMEAARAQMREAAEAAEAEAELPTPPGPVEAHDDSPPLDFKAAAHDDWERMKESLKESAAEQAAEDEDSDDELYAERCVICPARTRPVASGLPASPVALTALAAPAHACSRAGDSNSQAVGGPFACISVPYSSRSARLPRTKRTCGPTRRRSRRPSSWCDRPSSRLT